MSSESREASMSNSAVPSAPVYIVNYGRKKGSFIESTNRLIAKTVRVLFFKKRESAVNGGNDMVQIGDEVHPVNSELVKEIAHEVTASSIQRLGHTDIGRIADLYRARLIPDSALSLLASGKADQVENEFKSGFLNDFDLAVRDDMLRCLKGPDYFSWGYASDKEGSAELDGWISYHAPVSKQARTGSRKSEYGKMILSHLDNIEEGGDRDLVEDFKGKPNRVVMFDTIGVRESGDGTAYALMHKMGTELEALFQAGAFGNLTPQEMIVLSYRYKRVYENDQVFSLGTTNSGSGNLFSGFESVGSREEPVIRSSNDHKDVRVKWHYEYRRVSEFIENYRKQWERNMPKMVPKWLGIPRIN